MKASAANCIRQEKLEHMESHAESLRRKEKPDKKHFAFSAAWREKYSSFRRPF
jgi:hypothetical protein